MRLMTLNKTAKLGIILRERQKQDFILPCNPDDKPKKRAALKLKYASKDPNWEQLLGFI